MNDSNATLTRTLTLAAPALLATVTCLADDRPASPGEPNGVPYEHVIVEATRVAKDLASIPAAVAVVDAGDIQLGQQQLGLDESLTRVPGLFMLDRYNFAQDLRISIRGFGARANFGIRGIKILVDGIPETLPDGQGQVDSVDIGSAERIVVLRGPSSALYGNASGGVINISSERGTPQPFVEARLSAGEYGFQKHQLKFGGERGRVNYLLNLTHLDFDGYRDHSETRSSGVNARFHVDIDANSDLAVNLNVTDSPQANDPGGINREDATANPRQARGANVNFDAGESLEQQRLGFAYTRRIGDKHEFRVRNYYVWRDFANKLPFTGGGSVDLERFFVGGGASYSYQGELAGRANRFTAGIDIDLQDDDRLRFDNNLGVLGPLVFDQNEEVTSVGVFAQNEFSLGEHLELTVGIRRDRIKFDVTDRFVADGDDSGSLTFEETSPMAGLLWRATPAVNLYATVSSSFETPTTTELANPGGGGGFNPLLEPQSATNYEVGIKGNLGDRTWFDAAVFSIDVDKELIPFELASQPGRDFFENAGESSRKGIELAVTVRPTEYLETALAYTYSDFSFDRFVDDNGNDFGGNVIPGTPENLLNAEIKYSHPAGYYGVWNALYVDELFVNNANAEKNDAYVVSSLRLGYTWSNDDWQLSPFLGINNLFDEDYSGNVRVNAFGGRFFEPAPDRNLYGGVGIRYRF